MMLSDTSTDHDIIDAAPDRGILLVDPDPTFREEFTAALCELDWRVWSTSEPDNAVHLLGCHQSDICVAMVDLEMPGLQGMRVLTELHRCRPDLVRCGLSTAVSPYTAIAFRRLSDTLLFSKPIDASTVSATLSARLQRDHGRRQPSLQRE